MVDNNNFIKNSIILNNFTQKEPIIVSIPNKKKSDKFGKTFFNEIDKSMSPEMLISSRICQTESSKSEDKNGNIENNQILRKIKKMDIIIEETEIGKIQENKLNTPRQFINAQKSLYNNYRVKSNTLSGNYNTNNEVSNVISSFKIKNKNLSINSCLNRYITLLLLVNQIIFHRLKILNQFLN